MQLKIQVLFFLFISLLISELDRSFSLKFHISVKFHLQFLPPRQQQKIVNNILTKCIAYFTTLYFSPSHNFIHTQMFISLKYPQYSAKLHEGYIHWCTTRYSVHKKMLTWKQNYYHHLILKSHDSNPDGVVGILASQILHTHHIFQSDFHNNFHVQLTQQLLPQCDRKYSIFLYGNTMNSVKQIYKVKKCYTPIHINYNTLF